MISYLVCRYNSAWCEEVLRGEESEETAFQSFIDKIHFYIANQYNGSDHLPSDEDLDHITFDQFEAFYLIESIFYPHDDQF